MKQAAPTTHSTLLSLPLHSFSNKRRALSKYCTILLLAGFALFIGSCQKENINPGSQTQSLLSSSQEQQSSQKQQKKTVPFKAKFETLEESICPTKHRITGTGREHILANLPLWLCLLR